ncbi:hypothetical protein [Bradyrhizobium mercantei]|uniref:hypothetical protein n=1 Tax=Bradyrhizobium mercantei TaxID=1904807 RepID=UPI001FD8F738|nr:hypothetical protein [Bradyrhizobium mercantei]
MGLLFVGVLAGVLIGFGCFAPSGGYLLGCASQPCFDRFAAVQPAQPVPTASSLDHPAIVKSNSATRAVSGKKSSKKRRSADLTKTSFPRTRMSVSRSERPADISDPVLDKAKLTVATKMGDAGSAEFSDMKRAMRKNMLGRPVDTICGRVKGRSASGSETGERPFLYLVKEDEAYVVGGQTGSAASIAYRNICN